MSNLKTYFSEYFEIEHELLEKEGLLDISLVCDNPAFVDPFLIFANPKYKELNNFIVSYLRFLRDDAIANKTLDKGKFEHYYKFPEVKQVWLGYSIDGNAGQGLGHDFAESLFDSLHSIFRNFGEEKITDSAHIEKLCLLKDGVGVDKISDFTINLIKLHLLKVTQEFAVNNIDSRFLKEFAVEKVYFNLATKMWEGARFILPTYTWKGKESFVLLVPNEILAKEDTWISKSNFLKNNKGIFSVISNAELRLKMNAFFEANLFTKLNKNNQQVKDESVKSKLSALRATVREYPELLDYYIKQREDSREIALETHAAKAEQVNFFEDAEHVRSSFLRKKYEAVKSHEDCLERLIFFKNVIESNAKNLKIDGNHFHEKQLQLLFKMVTYESMFDYNSEVNNGQGPIDFIISMGSKDKTGLEFKLAKNTKLKQNLKYQTEVYKKNSGLTHIIKVVFFFTTTELNRVNRILAEVKNDTENEKVILIDCREKESASNTKTL